MNNWISVKERLPEIEALLYTTSGIIVLGDRYDNKWRVCGHWRHDGTNWISDLTDNDITHWMPLPEPPKL
jgi:hypothetical protein